MLFVHDPGNNWAPAPPRNGQPMRRRGPPPCKLCPKKSPDVAWLYELSDKNAEAFEHWKRHRSMNFNGMTDAEKADPIVQRNFAIIDSVMRAYEAAEQRAAAVATIQAAVQSAVITRASAGR
jgi:hypothetical protein